MTAFDRNVFVKMLLSVSQKDDAALFPKSERSPYIQKLLEAFDSAGHISNKTLYIALNYEEQAERMNAESAHEIAKELFALECEQRRLTYFIGLLDKRQAEVIRLVFVDGIPTKEVAASFGLTYRTIDRIKRTAIENLAEMYAYSDQFRV